MLVILSGLPGSGKTTVARLVCRELGATHLRIDAIEQALRAANGDGCDVGAAGYLVAYRLADENLRNGVTVVADCVNPIVVTRTAWRRAAKIAGVSCLDVGIVCSDEIEHRRRIEARIADIEGHVLPRWRDVVSRAFESFELGTLLVDTAHRTAEACAADILAALAGAQWRGR